MKIKIKRLIWLWWYNNGKILFEGEYLNGYKWNGKFFDEKNNYTELKNGEGIIKDYFTSGTLFYEGHYLNGKCNGKGREYDDQGIVNENAIRIKF